VIVFVFWEIIPRSTPDQHTLTPFVKAGFPKAVFKILIIGIWNFSLFNILFGTGRFDEL